MCLVSGATALLFFYQPPIEIGHHSTLPFPVLFLPHVIMPTILGLISTLVYRDAQRRGMDPWLWATVATFVPNLPGVIIYLVMRHSHNRVCLHCRRGLQFDFLSCPYCGHGVETVCAQCRKAVAPYGQSSGGSRTVPGLIPAVRKGAWLVKQQRLAWGAAAMGTSPEDLEIKCNANMHDYKVPTALDVPLDHQVVAIDPQDTECNLVGYKGWGGTGPQLREQGTIGGNLCQRPRCWYFRGSFPCARKGGETCFAVEGESQYHAIFGEGPCFFVHPSDLAVALSALQARLTILGPGGSRTVPIESFSSDRTRASPGRISFSPTRFSPRSILLRRPPADGVPIAKSGHGRSGILP